VALNQKKKAFADAKRAGKSNRDAAIAAGLSEKTAAQAGSRLAKDPDVIAYLARVSGSTPGNANGEQPDAEAGKQKRLNVVKGGKSKGEPDEEAPRAPTPEERAAMWAALGVERVTQPDPGKADAPVEPGDPAAVGPNMMLLLQNIALGYVEATTEQIKAATAVLPYMYAKRGETGKKDEAKENAKKAASKFGRAPPGPRLAASGGKPA
jgi:phage terminase small subunit